jgi:hypothetical protein
MQLGRTMPLASLLFVAQREAPPSLLRLGAVARRSLAGSAGRICTKRKACW